MKHTLALAALLTGLSAHATIHTVTCQNGPYHFLPVTVHAVVGDTIYWTWVSGTHIVGPISATDIPAGALLWNVPIDAGHLDFEYVVPVQGDYHYVCHPAAPHGEDGYIEVSGTTSVQDADPLAGSSAFYPNPFDGDLTIEAADANGIAIYDLLGQPVMFAVIQPGRSKRHVDLGDLPKGIYFCSILLNGVVQETRRVVKN